ncbi:MAG: tetratricopeptide repeat protein [Devosia sp.]|uniref:O-linked N-acetylglucosamine transferase, SPINDLY family protein n=1 Tax=Devosia sp. TaxID=1871048 RepID=UPI001ACF9C3A|nr:tetratricopeptide repeat protein [Devosia sp.]MBN9317523.1 tetratricopeptide repeat protein [Devosia sp.]
MTTAAAAFEQAFAAHQQGRLDAAAAGYEAVIGLEPGHGEALHMLGVVRMQQGDPVEGARLIGQAVRLRPDDARARSNLASALVAASRFDEAIEVARRATELAPASVDAWGNLGTALSRRDRYPEAIEPFRRALALQPGRAGLHSGLGHALGMVGRYEEALESHRKAIELAPGKAGYRNNMALTLRSAGLTAEAEAMLRAIVEDGNTDPDYFAALASLLRKQGKIVEAISAMEQANASAMNPELAGRLAFLRNYVDSTTIESQLEQARQHARAATAGIQRFAAADADRDPSRRLRVGLVSSDLRQHAVALFLLGVLRELDPAQVELFAYSGTDTGDPVNQAFQALIRNWRGTSSLTDRELAEQVRRDRIDILIDLSGPTAGGRLKAFAYKPAPVALIWLGYSGTSGHEAIDYILGDAIVLPDRVVQSVEQPWRLPDAYLCFSPTQAPPPVGPLPARANGYVTFGSFNNLNKLSSATLDAWAAVLDAVPDSRLQIKAHQGVVGPQPAIDGLVQRGVAADRIATLEWVDGWCRHLPLYDRFDIGLDPFPYNGTTTTCESLLMGVPVVTLKGDRFISRVGASLMHTVGLDDWIAETVGDYVALAVKRAADLEQLAQVRTGLRTRLQASPLGDTRRFARNFEAALRQMWIRHCTTA